MKIISVNVGLPRLVLRNDEPVSTGIFKESVAGRVMMRTLNLDGDRQADLSVHGGPQKAVYVYPSEHYDFWKQELPDMDLSWACSGKTSLRLVYSKPKSTLATSFGLARAK